MSLAGVYPNLLTIYLYSLVLDAISLPPGQGWRRYFSRTQCHQHSQGWIGNWVRFHSQAIFTTFLVCPWISRGQLQHLFHRLFESSHFPTRTHWDPITISRRVARPCIRILCTIQVIAHILTTLHTSSLVQWQAICNCKEVSILSVSMYKYRETPNKINNKKENIMKFICKWCRVVVLHEVLQMDDWKLMDGRAWLLKKSHKQGKKGCNYMVMSKGNVAKWHCTHYRSWLSSRPRLRGKACCARAKDFSHSNLSSLDGVLFSKLLSNKNS